MKLNSLIICLLLFILAFVPRLYRIDNPIADWHSWRQADTAALTRNFIKQGFSPLFPKFDSYYALNDRSDQNPNRYFLAEFPIYNIMVYPIYRLFGVNELYHRLVTVFISSLTAVFLYLLVRKYSSHRAAILSAIFFAVLPYSVYYGRVTMPDPLHLLFTVTSLYFITLWCQKQKIIYLLLAGFTSAGILLTKPYGLVLALPIGYLLIRKFGLKLFSHINFYLYAVITLVPFLLWRYHISLYPEGQFGTDWLFNSNNIRFTGSFFRWIIFDRLNRLIFATGGFVLFFLGLIRGWTKKEGFFYFVWLISILTFFVIIATGNVTHDYYQLPILPVGCIFMALGFEFLVSFGNRLLHRLSNFIIAISLFVLMLAFGWYEVRGFFNINHWEIVRAGQAVDQLLPADAKVIAPYQTDSAFLYQTNRTGWTIGGDFIERFIDEGATHLVSVNFDDETNYWAQKCQVVTKTDFYIIIDLTDCQIEFELNNNQPDLPEFPSQNDVYM